MVIRLLVALLLFTAAPVLAQTNRVNNFESYVTRGEGSAYWATQCQLNGAVDACADIDADIRRIWLECEWHSSPITASAHNVVRFRLQFEPLNQGRSVRHAVELLGCAPPKTDPLPIPDTPDRADPPTRGVVHLDNYSFADDSGPYLALGFTCFWCLQGALDFDARTQENLDVMADRGFNYARILTVVGGPYWSAAPDLRLDPSRSDFFEGFDRLFEMASSAGSVDGRRGIKLQVVIFGDVTEYLTTRREQTRWMDTIADYLDGHREQILFVEIANESSGVGLDADDLKVLADHWARVSDIPTALSAVYVSDGDLRGFDGYTGLERFFDKYPDTKIDILTPHFDRDLREEGYRSARQSWEAHGYSHVPTRFFVNNEPIGCGSSVARICDPDKLVADALNTYVGGGAGYVYHTDAGVKLRRDFADVENFDLTTRAFGAMLSLLPGRTSSGRYQNHHWGGHPFRDLIQTWPDLPSGSPGVTRAYATEVGGKFYVVLTGLRDRYIVEAKWGMVVEVFAAVDGDILTTRRLRAGERFTVRQRDSKTRTYILRVTRS